MTSFLKIFSVFLFHVIIIFFSLLKFLLIFRLREPFFRTCHSRAKVFPKSCKRRERKKKENGKKNREEEEKEEEEEEKEEEEKNVKVSDLLQQT